MILPLGRDPRTHGRSLAESCLHLPLEDDHSENATSVKDEKKNQMTQQAKPHRGTAWHCQHINTTQVGFRRHLLTTLQPTGKGLSVTCNRVMVAQIAAALESSFGTLEYKAKVAKLDLKIVSNMKRNQMK